MDTQTIRKAVLAHRGGLEGLNDQQIMTVWYSLDDTTRKEYLKGESNAVGDRPKRDFHDRS